MKLIVLQENLNKGLTVAARTVASRPQLPVLTHVLLSTEKGRLKISSTNLETGVNLWLGAKIEKEGAISIPAKIFSEFVASLPAGKVELQARGGLLKLKSGSYEASFNGMAASEFPKVPSVSGKSNLGIEPQVFITTVSQVSFAAASDETRPALTGVYLFVKDESLNLVATDGYRLSVKTLKMTLEAEAVSQLKKGLIVPAKAFQEAARIAGEEEGEVKFYLTLNSNQLIFQVGGTEIVTRLIEAKFPEFEKIIPERGEIRTTVETDEFARVVKMASIFARESANIVRLSLSQDGVEVAANTAQVGENKGLVETKVEGGEAKIAFNSRYLLDFLGVVGESFYFEMNGPLSPGVFKSGKDTSFLHVIMPVRVQE
jgi:DNA polymerase-3 subunit beta